MAKSGEQQAFYKFSFWLSQTEYNNLKKRAAHQRLSTYARQILFYSNKKIITLHQNDAAHILALLGKTRLHSNINQIAHAIHCGIVDYSQEEKDAILETKDDIQDIRKRLIIATGKKV